MLIKFCNIHLIFIKIFDDDGDDDIWGDFATGTKEHIKRNTKSKSKGKKKCIFIYLKIKSFTLDKVT